MGNSCYMNATLQALSFLRCFVTDINCDLWQRVATRGIFGHLAKVLKILHMRNASPEMSLIRQLKSAFVSVRPDFDNFFQQDAHEFLCMTSCYPFAKVLRRCKWDPMVAAAIAVDRRRRLR
jgi:uncharacterized UBP type Zn finger protein